MAREDSTGQDEQKKGGRGPGGNNRVLLAGAVAGIIVLAVIAAALLLPQGTGSSPAPAHAATPAAAKTTMPLATASEPFAPGSVTPLAEPEQNPVDFQLRSGDMASCGLTCRQLTATITNLGDMTAHDVCITLRMHNSRGDVIRLNGGDSLSQCIGDLAGGATKSEPVTINADCGLFATECLQETLTMETEVASTERTVRFPDTVIAV